MTDIVEDLLAFNYAVTGRTSLTDDSKEICPECGAELEEGDDGELRCPTCTAG